VLETGSCIAKCALNKHVAQARFRVGPPRQLKGGVTALPFARLAVWSADEKFVVEFTYKKTMKP
jgi:hypothetical protein